MVREQQGEVTQSMTTVLQLLLVLGLMVLVHEFGHFVVAKLCGVRVETFAIGFGKRVVGFRRGEHRLPDQRAAAGRIRQDGGRDSR
jgi:Zn-dependent protease